MNVLEAQKLTIAAIADKEAKQRSAADEHLLGVKQEALRVYSKEKVEEGIRWAASACRNYYNTNSVDEYTTRYLGRPDGYGTEWYVERVRNMYKETDAELIAKMNELMASGFSVETVPGKTKLKGGDTQHEITFIDRLRITW